MDVNKWNNLSEKLRQVVREALPKQGQVLYFESLRPNGRGTTVLPKDRIFDPYAGENGEYVDIAYITGSQPGSNNGKEQDPNVYGRIQFRKSEGGTIPIRGGNRQDELKFTYLFLTNQNRTNKGQPWFVDPIGRKSCFRLVKASQDADAVIETERKIRMAGDKIDEMPDSRLREYAIGLDMKGITKFSSPNEIRVKLIKMTKTREGAERVMGLDKDVNIMIKNVLKAAEALNVVKRDTALGCFLWANGGDVICTVPPGKNAYQFMTEYFQTPKGSEVYKVISAMVDREQSRKEAERHEEKEEVEEVKPPAKAKPGVKKKEVQEA